MPAETINLEASSKDISKYIISFLGNINKKPLVGFGVVGTKTLTNLSICFFANFTFIIFSGKSDCPYTLYSDIGLKLHFFFYLFVFAKVSVI